MDWGAAITLVVTAALALAGYLITYLNNLRLEQRKARLDRVNRQLSDLYGPLYALTRATRIAWERFRAQFRSPDQRFWHGVPPPSEEERAAWRLWIEQVFMPANTEMQTVIIEHSDLLLESEIPACLLTLCAHVSSYKALIRQWQMGDYRQHLALVDFPGDELRAYTESSFLRLKAQQRELLGGDET
jgi:hypothetical protein